MSHICCLMDRQIQIPFFQLHVILSFRNLIARYAKSGR